MTLNKWGCVVTGWKSIRIYQYLAKVGEEETIQEKRLEISEELLEQNNEEIEEDILE